MTTVYLSPLTTNLQYFTTVGIVLSGGKINTYIAGTSAPQATYTDSTGVTPNANPIILNSAGQLPNVEIWQPAGVKIKAVITDSANNFPVTLDQLAGINDPTAVQTTFYGGTDTGSPNVYVVSIANFSASGYSNGTIIYWIPSNTNTGASTLSVINSAGTNLGAIAIVNANSSALVGGQLVSGQVYQVAYQGGSFILLNSASTYGSFTGTLTGVSGGVTGTVNWEKVGNIVFLNMGTGLIGTANANTRTVTGLPASLQPATTPVTVGVPIFQDNGAYVSVPVTAQFINGSGTITLQKAGVGNAWTNSGATGFALTNTVISYPIL